VESVSRQIEAKGTRSGTALWCYFVARVQRDRNVPLGDNRQGPAKNGANLTTPLASGAPLAVNRRRPLAALLLSAATVAALAVPAGADVPKTAPELTVPCNDGTGHSAALWMGRHFAAKNPCHAGYLVIEYTYSQGSQSKGEALNVAPGAHFNKGTPFSPVWYHVDGVVSDIVCQNWGTYVVAKNGHGKWGPPPANYC
jgi:hypothetical protein